MHKGVTGEMRVTEIFETSVIDSLERVAFVSFVWNDVEPRNALKATF